MLNSNSAIIIKNQHSIQTTTVEVVLLSLEVPEVMASIEQAVLAQLPCSAYLLRWAIVRTEDAVTMPSHDMVNQQTKTVIIEATYGRKSEA